MKIAVWRILCGHAKLIKALTPLKQGRMEMADTHYMCNMSPVLLIPSNRRPYCRRPPRCDANNSTRLAFIPQVEVFAIYKNI